MNKLFVLVMGFIVYIASTYASYAYFSTSVGGGSGTTYQKPVSQNGEVIDNSPKTEECPLNGMMYSKEQRATWETRRPLGIMVQNNIEARPQSGLSSADVIYEAVAEGGITRFLAMYYCESPKIVGSVRSARIYFLRILQGYGANPLYGHVGGANTPGPANALGEIKKLGWHAYNDMDQFAVPFPNYWRDYDRLPGRATEHTVYTNTTKLWEYAAKNRKLTHVDEDGIPWSEGFEPWTFQDAAAVSDRGNVNSVSFYFWDDNLGSDYTVNWRYDKQSNRYKRINGGKEHIDFNTKKQLQADNVIIIFADESVADDGYDHGQHLLYDVLGKGDALIFQNGKAIEGKWEKPKAENSMKVYDESDKEIAFVRGKIWFAILPTGNKVQYGATSQVPKNTKKTSAN